MGKQGVTVRGKAWESKNSLWIIWSFFACAGIGFLITGRKIKEKKWIIIGIAYLVALWGGFWLQGVLGEGSAGETVVMVWCVIYIASIVHCFIVKKQYLKKLDLVMNEQEINLEQERIRREKEKLEMQKKLDAERLQREKEMIEQQKKAELDKERMLQELEQKRKENERLSQDIENNDKGKSSQESIENHSEKNNSEIEDANIVETENSNVEANIYQKSNSFKWIVPVAVIGIILAIILFNGESTSNGISGTYIHTRGIGHTIDGYMEITDDNFTWTAYGAELANGSYEVDEENHLIKVEGQNYDFVFTRNDDGEVEAISRVVNGEHQEIYYREN